MSIKLQCCLLLVLCSLVLLAGCQASFVHKVEHWHGKDKVFILNELGPADRTLKVNPFKDYLSEFQIEIYNTYPHGQASSNVTIEELHWDHGYYSTAVWFHQVNGKWIVLDTVQWTKDVQF